MTNALNTRGRMMVAAASALALSLGTWEAYAQSESDLRFEALPERKIEVDPNVLDEAYLDWRYRSAPRRGEEFTTSVIAGEVVRFLFESPYTGSHSAVDEYIHHDNSACFAKEDRVMCIFLVAGRSGVQEPGFSVLDDKPYLDYRRQIVFEWQPDGQLRAVQECHDRDGSMGRETICNTER